MDGQRSGERQMHFKVTQPLEPFRRAEIRAGRVIAHRAPVVGNKAERRLLRGIVRHLLVVRIGEGVGVDPREVGDIEKAFDLAAGKSLHLEGRAVDLLKSRVVPVRHGR